MGATSSPGGAEVGGVSADAAAPEVWSPEVGALSRTSARMAMRQNAMMAMNLITSVCRLSLSIF
jgi:hypothetical protein